MRKSIVRILIIIVCINLILCSCGDTENQKTVNFNSSESYHVQNQDDLGEYSALVVGENTQYDSQQEYLLEDKITEQNAISESDLYQNEFREKIIEGGLIYQGKVLIDIDNITNSGELFSSDAAACAEKIGQGLIVSLETGTLPNQECERLEENWIANPYYDCYYVDMTDAECVGFLYYIYPDYDCMGVETASAVTYRYNVDTHTGELIDAEMEVYPMTREGYQAEREKMGEKFQVIKDGWFLTLTGRTDIVLTGNRSAIEDVGQWLWDDLQADGLENGKTGEVFVGVEPSQLTQIDSVVREKREEGWNLKKYDGYYLEDIEQEDCVHGQYFCYLEKLGEEARTVIVLDTWISEDGIEDMRSRTFMTYWSTEEGKSVNTETKYQMDDIATFLIYDWTSDDVLMEHDIQPSDSGGGWDFIVADIDFDGVPEMLLYFMANNCGQNSLYIYKQQEEHIYSDTDTIAVKEKDIVSFINYKSISPYIRGDLLTAYYNGADEYRYLSLDYSDFGGDIHGGLGAICLYETILGEKSMPKELVRIEYSCPDNKIEMYFYGERVYEAGVMNEKLADYMAGYTEVNIVYESVEKHFPRDIVGFDEADKKSQLEDLYEALKELATN